MKKIIYLTLTITLVCLLQSCSIQKRQHLKGYNITWNSSLKKAKSIETIHENSSFHESITYEEIENVEKENNVSLITDENNTSDNADFSVSTKSKEELNPTFEDIKTSIDSEKVDDSNEDKTSKTKNKAVSNDEVKVTGFAVAALVCGILAMFAMTVWVAIIFALWAFTFWFIAVRKIKQNPETVKGRGMAWAGYILGLLGMVIWWFI